MPNGDRTGPNGMGAKTGRGQGQAVGNQSGRTTNTGRNRNGGGRRNPRWVINLNNWSDVMSDHI